MPMGLPPAAQILDHRRRQRHKPVLPALAAADVEARMRGVRLAQVAQFDADRLAHAQPGVIDQAQHRAITRQLHGFEQRGDLFAREHQRQRLWRGDAQFAKHRPAFDAEAVLEKRPQGALGHLHGRGPELPHLPQFEIIGAHLVLGQRGRVAPVMVAEPADVADVFLLGGTAKIFELDKRGELCDGWMVIHRRRVCP